MILSAVEFRRSRWVRACPLRLRLWRLQLRPSLCLSAWSPCRPGSRPSPCGYPRLRMPGGPWGGRLLLRSGWPVLRVSRERCSAVRGCDQFVSLLDADGVDAVRAHMGKILELGFFHQTVARGKEDVFAFFFQ